MTENRVLIETIQTLFIDFQETEIFVGIPRHIEIEAVPKKASVCIGVRRAGKSTLLFQRIERLLSEGVSRENILYLNFFDDRLHALRADHLGLILEAYYGLYPQKKNSEKIYIFFDEIQVLEGWENFVERIMRSEKCEVYLSGSSARMLSKEIATEMRGRAVSWEVFPFSFHEYLDQENIKVEEPFSTKNRLLIQNAFEKYWVLGGFPEVLTLDEHLRIKIHQEYFHTILFRDLIERHDIQHPKALTDLAYWLVDNVASLYSINKLVGFLKSQGHNLSKSIVGQYLEWFEDAYFLFTVRLYDASYTRSQSNPKKIYCIDHALVTSVSSGILVNNGHLLESLIFIALRRQFSNIFYYKTKNARKVDFIISVNRKHKILVQVCDTLAEPTTRKREVTAVSEAMQEQNLDKAWIVTRYEEETITLEKAEIQVICAWRFLLKLSTGTV